MYCNQCGKEIPDNSKFCSNCGCAVSEEEKTSLAPKRQATIDAVEDIKKKLKEIDNRKKPTPKKGEVIKSALNVVKGESSALGLIFGESFEEKKLADKKQLILDYPLPTSSKALANFAKYINLEIELKKREPDALTEVWKEKLKQIYLFAKTELSATKEFEEIQKCYNANKRRERHAAVREYIVFLSLPILAAFSLSIAFHWPLLMFASILAAGWEVFLILYVYDRLDDMIASIKQHSEKQKDVPKRLRVVAWYLFIPVLAALITAIAYHSVVLIVLFAVLLGMDFIFLVWFLCDIYHVDITSTVIPVVVLLIVISLFIMLVLLSNKMS